MWVNNDYDFLFIQDTSYPTFLLFIDEENLRVRRYLPSDSLASSPYPTTVRNCRFSFTLEKVICKYNIYFILDLNIFLTDCIVRIFKIDREEILLFQLGENQW